MEVRRLRADGDAYRWEGVEVKQYRSTGDFFRGITKQLFFDDAHGLSCEFRYFEVEPGGFSSFERHDHVHAVLILRGSGRILMTSEEGSRVHDVAEHDLIYISGNTWHQLQADEEAYFGFICLVENDRDGPVRPTAEEARSFRADPVIGKLIRL